MSASLRPYFTIFAAVLAAYSVFRLPLPANVAMAQSYPPGVSVCDKEITLPWEMKFAENGKKLYVSDVKAGRLIVISVASKKVIKILPTEEPTLGLEVSKNRHRLYAVSPDAKKLLVVDTKKDSIVDGLPIDVDTPQDIALTANEESAYVSSSATSKIYNYSFKKRKVIEEIPYRQVFVSDGGLQSLKPPIHAARPFITAGKFVNYGNTLLASPSEYTNDGYGVDILTVGKGKLISHITFDTKPDWAIFSPDDKTLYFKTFSGREKRKAGNNFIPPEIPSKIYAIDTKNFKAQKYISIAGEIGDGALSPDGKRLYLITQKRSAAIYKLEFFITVINLTRNEVESEIVIPSPYKATPSICH